jgi:hypothetical protein
MNAHIKLKSNRFCEQNTYIAVLPSKICMQHSYGTKYKNGLVGLYIWKNLLMQVFCFGVAPRGYV